MVRIAFRSSSIGRAPDAELRFPHLPEPVFLTGASSGFLELKAGMLYRVSVLFKTLGGGNARLRVQGDVFPKGSLAQLNLYPSGGMDAADRAMTLFGKALQLTQSLALTEREIRYIFTHAADFGGVSLSELPTNRVDGSPAAVAATVLRLGRIRRLAAYARLKRDLAGERDDLIGVFEANGTSAADRLDVRVYPMIAELTRRDAAVVKSVAQTILTPVSLSSEEPLQRVWGALQVVDWRAGCLGREVDAHCQARGDTGRSFRHRTRAARGDQVALRASGLAARGAANLRQAAAAPTRRARGVRHARPWLRAQGRALRVLPRRSRNGAVVKPPYPARHRLRAVVKVQRCLLNLGQRSIRDHQCRPGNG